MEAMIDAQYLCVVTVMNTVHGSHLISPHDTLVGFLFYCEAEVQRG